MKNQIKLKQVLLERNISVYRLSKDLGIANSTLYNIVNGKLYPYPRYRKMISDYLDVPEAELFDVD